MIPMATINAKNTAMSFRFFMLVERESLAVMKERWRVVGFGSFPRAEAESQCFARWRSWPVNNKDFSKSCRSQSIARVSSFV